MAASIVDWNIGQLLAGRSATQQKPTAAHVASSSEFCRKKQPVPENFKQRIDVFGSRNTPKQNHIARIACYFANLLTVAKERSEIALVTSVDIRSCDLPQAIEVHNCFR
jgi:hypothetical protein